MDTWLPPGFDTSSYTARRSAHRDGTGIDPRSLPEGVVVMGGKPSKGTPADKRIKGNKPGTTKTPKPKK